MNREHALVVVGAGGAFGSEIARRLVREGLQVVGISRSLEILAEISAELGGSDGAPRG